MGIREGLESLGKGVASGIEKRQAKKADDLQFDAITNAIGRDKLDEMLGGEGSLDTLSNAPNKVQTLNNILTALDKTGKFIEKQSPEEKFESEFGVDIDPNLPAAERGKLAREIKQQDALSLFQKKEDIKVKNAAMKSFNEAALNLAKASTDIERLRQASIELSEGLGDFEEGLFPQLKAMGQLFMGKATADPDVTQYYQTLNSVLIPLARNLMEEKGPIAENDVKKVEEALGDARIPVAQKEAALDELSQKVQLSFRMRAIYASGAKNVEEVDAWIQENNPLLYKTIFGAEEDEITSLLNYSLKSGGKK